MKASWGRSLSLLMTILACTFPKGVVQVCMIETWNAGDPCKAGTVSHTLSRAGRAQAEDRKKWMLAGGCRPDRREGLWQLLRTVDTSFPQAGYCDVCLGWLIRRGFRSSFHVLLRLFFVMWVEHRHFTRRDSQVCDQKEGKCRYRKRRKELWVAGGFWLEGRDQDCWTFALSYWGTAGKQHG